MGRDKALLEWHGSTMVRHISDVLQRVAAPVAVVHAAGQRLPELPGAEVVADAIPGRGPLEAMAAGMRALNGRCQVAFVSGVDTPLLHPEFVLAVAAALVDAEVAVPEADGRLHPLAAAYRLEMLPRVEAQLAADRLRLGDLLDGARTMMVDARKLAHGESLRNLNTDEQYTRARAEPQPLVVVESPAVGRRSLRAATLGQALAIASLPCEQGLCLNGVPIGNDPATALVDGDVVAVGAHGAASRRGVA